jgi:branched-chain amino acid transport system permease protein
MRALISALPGRQRQTLRTGSISLAALALLSLPWVLGLFFAEVLDNTGIYIMMGLGLNIVVGFAGMLDLGYVAFYAIGAYTMAILTTLTNEIVFTPELNFWVALPIAVGCAILAGVILGVPVLKVRGDYLAIVTLGFGEIIRLLALSDALRPWLGGARGVDEVPNPALGPFSFATPIAAFIALRVKDSRLGRAWIAIREDEDVAESMGVDTVRTKLLAFGMGAAFAGVAGAIFASKLGTIYPHSFGLLISINVLALIIIGGMGSIPGVIVGALVLVGLPELLREFQDFRYLIYGAVLVLMMLVRPEGLWPERMRQRELHEAAEEVAESGLAAADEELSREGAAG